MSVTFPLWRISRLRMATDGQGVTALVCAQGCPLDCRLCINQDSKTFETSSRVTPEELYDRVKQDGLYYTATGGGVTFGGGEPLLHTAFIAEFRKIIPPEWRIYAESSLFIPEKNVIEAAEAVSHFFIDIKDTNPEIYRAYTGQDNQKVLYNLKTLISAAGAEKITVRVPLIPDFNTNEDRKKTELLLKEYGITNFDFFNYKIPRPKK